MHTKTEISHRVTPATARPGQLFLRVLNWLADSDRRYREAQKLRNLPDERLQDMGLSRRDAETAYRR